MRRRDTISPAAQSIDVTINGTPAAVINRTNAPSQSVSLDAPVGNDAFAFNVYDQANALGHLLGSANVVQQIVDGAANQVAATITAICAATNVSLAAPDPLSYTTFAPSGVYASSMQSIVLAGQTPVGLFGYPEDADGNVIISPPGGKLTATITGSAGLIVNNGYLLHLTPLTGPRSTTPDTLTVAAPSCPSTTVAVSHSPAIYAEDRQYGVGIYDWYGDLLSSGTMASGDVLIGYDSVSHELIARNPTTNTITGYSPDLSIQSSLFTISYLTAAASWANSVNGAFYATEFSDSPNRYNKGYFVSSNGTGTLVGSGVGTSSTVVLGASTFTTSSYGFVSTDGSVSNFNLTVQGNALASNGHDAGTILGLAPDDHNGTLVAFNQSSPYVSVFSENLVGLPTSGDYGITATPFLGAIDTDGDNIYVNTSVNLEASSATGTPLSRLRHPHQPWTRPRGGVDERTLVSRTNEAGATRSEDSLYQFAKRLGRRFLRERFMTASIVRIVSVGLTGAILCACGGGGSAVPSSPRSTSKKFAQATFTIKWTNTTATAAMRRKDTISPSAQSIAVLINGISNTIANRTGGSTQSIVLNAPVGTDTFAFNVYDQLNAQGHLLGAAAVTQQIVDGAANVVNAAIQAVCSATNVGFTGNDLSAFATLSEPGRAQTVTSIVVAGQASANLVIAPEDVDGDVIISGTGGAIDYSISGSATVTPIDGETLSLKPLTGPRATTPDTLTVSAPGCPSATVGVEHSPAIYTQHDGNEVTVQDWYGEHSAPLTITTGDTLIGFDPVSQKVIAYNSSTGKVNAYTVGLTSSTTLYTITPGSTVTWSNNLHSIIGFRPAAGALPAQFYTYASGAIQTYSLSPLGNVTLLAASTLSSNASLIAFTSTNTFYDFASETVPSLNGIFQVGTPSYNAFAINGATAEVYGFFASGSSYVSVWPVSIFNTPTTGNLGFTDFATLAGVDTDANIIYAIVDGNLEASTPAGTPLNIPANAYNSATAMVVISTNEQ